MTDEDTISMSDGYSFSTDPLLSIIKVSSPTYENRKYMRLPNQTRLIGNNISWLIDGITSIILRIPLLELIHFTKSHKNIY